MSTTQSTHPTLDRTNEPGHARASQRQVAARTYRQALFAKEAKQLAPLLIALSACGIVLHLLGRVISTTGPDAVHGLLMVLIPLLFAIGTGPMLVSQEKEQRTLGWIGSLPVRRRSIVSTKLIVGALGLSICWLISMGLTWLFAPSVFWQSGLNEVGSLVWISSTFFLLTMGFALAWLLPTAVSSLIALLLASFAAIMLSGLVQFIADEYFWAELEFPAQLMIQYLVMTAIFAVVAVRYGNSSFTAGGENESAFSSFGSWFRQRNRLSREESQVVFQTKSQPSSLIWQIGRQNSLLWVGLMMIALMGIIFLCFALNFAMAEEFLQVTFVLCCLVLSWLGASVFGSDSHRQRIRFLAERGVAPGLVWWTRLILPLSCVAIGLLVFYLINWVSLSQLGSPSRSDAMPPIDIRVSITFGAMLIFAFTQWFSQWTRSTLIAFCIAPAAAVFAIGYQAFALDFLNASWWLLVATPATAFLATRVMMRTWMDGQFGLRYWMSHCALLTVAVVIPAIPFLITYAKYPDMPSAMKRELATEAKQYTDNYTKPIWLPLKTNSSSSIDGADTERSDMVDAVNDLLGSLERQLLTTDGPIFASGDALRLVGTEVGLMSLRVENDEAERDESGEEYRQRYQRSIVLFSKLASRMRMSERLFDQECADRIERWLVTELERPGCQDTLEAVAYAEIVESLGDRDVRHQARRRAVVFAWMNSQSNQGQNLFGGMQLPTSRANSIATSWLVKERDIGAATAELLRYLEEMPSESDRYPEELRAYWPQSSLASELLPSPDFDLVGHDAPGMLWHREWETTATQMVESLRYVPATKDKRR